MLSRFLCFFILTLAFLASQAYAYSSDDVEWVSAKTATLHWGNSVTVDNYTIVAEDFSKDGFAFINIFKDNNLIDSGALGLSDDLVYRDTEGGNDIKVFVSTLSITVDDWKGNLNDPTVTVQVYKRGLPDLDVKVNIKKDSYDPTRLSTPRFIEGNVTIKNVGDAKASNVVLNVDTAGLKLAEGKLTQTVVSLEKDESIKPMAFKLQIPLLWDEENFKIVAQVIANDINNEKHMFNGTKTITVKPKADIILTKSCTKEIYMGETAYVSLIARNTGSFAIYSITVNDSVNENLNIEDDMQLKKIISLGPGQTVNVFTYSIKPIKPGTFTLPKATANFTADGKEYSLESNAPVLAIKGPYILLEKKSNVSSFNPGDNVLITVSIRNEGNMDANVKVEEEVPDNARFVSGTMYFNSVVNARSTKSFSYALYLENEADMQLPAASGIFIDLAGYKGEVNSSTLSIPLRIPGSEVVYQSLPEDQIPADAAAEGEMEGVFDTEGQEDMQIAQNSDISETSQSSSDSYEDKAISGINPDLRQQPGFEAWALIVVFFLLLMIDKKKI